MILKYNTYKDVKLWDKDYIVSIPNGEVIYFPGIDVVPLIMKKLIKQDNNAESNIYTCSDYDVPKIMNYISDKKRPPEEITRTKIEEFLELCGLSSDQIIIHDNMSVDVNGPVNMSFMNLKKIPFKFNRCYSDFICSKNKLETLENSPYVVHGSFICNYNNLKNLIHGPLLVSNTYNCSNNNLTSLIGAPTRLKDFNCSFNELKNLDYAPTVTGNFIKNDNLLDEKI